jgi:hypothetical protein
LRLKQEKGGMNALAYNEVRVNEDRKSLVDPHL